MADTDKSRTESPAIGGEGSSKVRAGGWSDAERNQLMLRVLATLLPDGKGVEWKRIEMEGRTLKAMQGQWTSIMSQIRDLNLSDDGVATPTKPKAARKKSTPKKAVKAEGDDANNGDDDDDEAGERAQSPKKPATPRKRAAASAGEGSAKKRRAPKKTPAKVEADEDDEAGKDVKSEENADDKEQ